MSNFDIRVDGQTNHGSHVPYVVHDLWNQRKQIENVKLRKKLNYCQNLQFILNCLNFGRRMANFDRSKLATEVTACAVLQKVTLVCRR